MPISENQLRIWATLHQTKKAKNTHEIVRNAIKNYNFLRNYDFEDYLQGSYRNNTNIWADTDVDIVIQLNSIFRYDISNLLDNEQYKFNNSYRLASFSLKDFRDEVIQVLESSFGYERVKIGNKSIKVLVDSSGNMYNADVVIAMQYRLYIDDKYENTKTDEIGLNYYEGILFKTLYSEEIINYPKLHYQNGVKKQENTNSQFKSIVRILKNMRNAAYEKRYLFDKNITPSYFIQCLLYNVPDDLFYKNTYQEIVVNILNYLQETLNSNYENFISQNEIVPLFGYESDKWDISNARIFINSLIKMWNEWS